MSCLLTKLNFQAAVGLYVRDGQVYQVRPSKRDPKHRYALWVGNLIDTAVFGDQQVYMRDLVYELKDDERMAPEQARQYGDIAGRCAWCGHRLDTPESVVIGLGPVCRKYIGKDHLKNRNPK